MGTHVRHLAVLAAVALVSGCGITWDGSGDASTAGPSATTSASASASPTPRSASASPTSSVSATPSPSAAASASAAPDVRSQPRVTAAISDTATRERVAVDQVVVAAWSPVTWSDGSLGCPQPGMSYTQALVAGEVLILRVDERLFQYHARTGGPFTYCANPSAGYAVG